MKSCHFRPRWATLAPFLLLLAAVSACDTASADPPSPGYELLYADEFNGSKVNEKDWKFRLGPRTGLNIDGQNVKEAVRISQGALQITCWQDVVNGKRENFGGGLISTHQFGYGYYETLSKPFMAGRGVHAAFWQCGGAVPNNDIFEIDSYEIDSGSWLSTNNLYMTLGTKTHRVPWPHRANLNAALRPDGWFLDGYEYTPDGVIFYDNGKVVARAEWRELTAAQAVWLTALNGVGKVEPDKLPGTTQFAYFRYYAKDYPGINLLPNGGFEYNQDKIPASSPIAWQQEGTAGASQLVRGNAARDNYKLRQASPGGAYRVTTKQSLEYIRNGDYALTARIRSSGGQKTAQVIVSGYGGKPLMVSIPASDRWQTIALPAIRVAGHAVTVAVESEGKAKEWLEIDDIRFFKPVPGGGNPETAPFTLMTDPIWRLAQAKPVRFVGDSKFYFFDRNVGIGEAISVSFTVNPDRRDDTCPLARQPKTGAAGWSILLTERGQIIFRIGSAASHRDIIAGDAYVTERDNKIVCVFDRGTARIYVDGILKAQESGIEFTTTDGTAAGRLGTVSDQYDAVGDVVAETSGEKGRSYHPFVGTLSDIRIYNRALPAAQIVDGKGLRP